MGAGARRFGSGASPRTIAQPPLRRHDCWYGGWVQLSALRSRLHRRRPVRGFDAGCRAFGTADRGPHETRYCGRAPSSERRTEGPYPRMAPRPGAGRGRASVYRPWCALYLSTVPDSPARCSAKCVWTDRERPVPSAPRARRTGSEEAGTRNVFAPSSGSPNSRGGARRVWPRESCHRGSTAVRRSRRG